MSVDEKVPGECGRIDCHDPGTHRPILTVRAWIGEAGLDATLDVPVCVTHRAESKPEDFISSEGWEVLSTSYRATRSGNPPPLRGLTTLKWEPLGESPIFDREEAAP